MKKSGFSLPLPNGSSFLMVFIKLIFKAVDDIFEIYFFSILMRELIPIKNVANGDQLSKKCSRLTSGL